MLVVGVALIVILFATFSLGILYLFGYSIHPRPTLFGFLTEWQTGIGAMVGLLGLMIVEAVRGELDRRRAEDLRHREKLNLAAMLRWEIEHLAQDLDRLRASIDSFKGRAQNRLVAWQRDAGGRPPGRPPLDTRAFQAIRLPEPMIFATAAPRMATLDSQVRRAVVHFYEYYLETRQRVDQDLDPKAHEIIAATRLTAVETPAGKGLAYARMAIEALDRLLPQEMRIEAARYWHWSTVLWGRKPPPRA